MRTKGKDYASIFQVNNGFRYQFPNQIYCFYGCLTKYSIYKFAGILQVRDNNLKRPLKPEIIITSIPTEFSSFFTNHNL